MVYGKCISIVNIHPHPPKMHHERLIFCGGAAPPFFKGCPENYSKFEVEIHSVAGLWMRRVLVENFQ